MNLKALLASVRKYEAHGSLDVDLTGISYDSRKVQPGHLFAALPGVHYHGLQFLPQAEQLGAAAVLTDRTPNTKLPQVIAEDPREALALISNTYYKNPSNQLKLFGVTGTNGKTTSTFLLRSIMQAANLKCGLLGTVQYSGQSFQVASKLTTPESLDLQQMLRQMVEESCSACVMEVSSHSLVQHRVTGCTFESAIFTNLTQDHLDYHQTMEEYYKAKRMLFDGAHCTVKTAAINIDDDYGRRLLKERQQLNLAAVTYGFSEEADFHIAKWNSSPNGSEITIRHQLKSRTAPTPLIAKFNAYNIAGAFAAASSSGIREDIIIQGIAQMKQVPGRLERIDHGQPYLVLIDYAHTEDALRQLLATVRPYTKRKLIVLFGCGGERDKGKRPLMGRAAGELADVVVLSSDNPRHEDPRQIIEEVRAGVVQSGNSNLRIYIDRKEAIAETVKSAQPGDALVLAGKGHENYQVIGDEKQHFDEREILEELLK